MNETAKNEMRNYLSAAGFFVFALTTLMLCVLLHFQPENSSDILIGTDIVCSLLLVLVGILLAVLGKRDLTAISFLMFGSIKLVSRTISGPVASDALFVYSILQVFLLILALILLTAKDKAKYPLALLIGVGGICNLIGKSVRSLNEVVLSQRLNV